RILPFPPTPSRAAHPVLPYRPSRRSRRAHSRFVRRAGRGPISARPLAGGKGRVIIGEQSNGLNERDQKSPLLALRAGCRALTPGKGGAEAWMPVSVGA